MNKLHSVITTIQAQTESVMQLASRLGEIQGRLVIIGDKKGPANFNLDIVEGFRDHQLLFLSLEAQLESEFELARKLPYNHYGRKNIGYLQAIADGAGCIYETDDDNAPLPSWEARNEYTEASTLRVTKNSANQHEPVWVNVYKHFSEKKVWPRGLPLEKIHDPVSKSETIEQVWAPIQQGLVNGSPDVDAIWRLVMEEEFSFFNNQSVLIQPGQWCPFNTQSTWWWPVAYPLLYVPSYCSFRMCDIWKSFVAQRCLWELGTGVVFHAPEVYQERNPHSLMRDFSDEVVGYEQNSRIARFLQSTALEPGKDAVEHNLLACYRALIDKNIFPKDEILLLETWLTDLKQTKKASRE